MENTFKDDSPGRDLHQCQLPKCQKVIGSILDAVFGWEAPLLARILVDQLVKQGWVEDSLQAVSLLILLGLGRIQEWDSRLASMWDEGLPPPPLRLYRLDSRLITDKESDEVIDTESWCKRPIDQELEASMETAVQSIHLGNFYYLHRRSEESSVGIFA